MNEKNFWQNLKKPFFVLAPMADVADIAFRRLIIKYSEHGKSHGGPDVIYTEFVSVDGLVSLKGRPNTIKDLRYYKMEQPIVAQVFGAKHENFAKCARIIKDLGFAGIDINMGCPHKKVEKQGAGAALIKNSQLARAIIRETKKGAGNLPVSVKTRIGYNKNIIKEWTSELLKEEIAAIAIHGRTRREMSEVPAHWDAIKEAVACRDKVKKETLIIGNGDVRSLADGQEKAAYSGVDGVMVGRGIFGNPWFFSQKTNYITTRQKLKALIEHAYLFEKLLIKKQIKNFSVMKKHIKAYVSGFDGAKELRIKLMETESASEIEQVIGKWL